MLSALELKRNFRSLAVSIQLEALATPLALGLTIIGELVGCFAISPSV